jgi:DnaJ-class molecular chaperone
MSNGHDVTTDMQMICPHCSGQGKEKRATTFLSFTNTKRICRVCNGAKRISVTKAEQYGRDFILGRYRD